jgi:hypothetical protein
MIIPGLIALSLMVQQAPPFVPVPFAPGERLHYDARAGFFPVGGAVITVEAPDTVLGDSAHVLTMEAEGGLPGAQVGYKMRSWVERTRFSSRRFYTTAIQSGTAYERRYIIRGDSLRYREEGSHTDLEGAADGLDELAMLYYLRTLNIASGDSVVLQRYFKKNYNPVTVHMLGHQPVTGSDGVVRPCLVYRINAIGSNTTLWLTEDARRVPAQVEIPLGTYVVTLTWDGRG